MSERWTAELRDGDALAFRVGRDGDRYVAEWPSLARLAVSADGAWHELVADSAASPSSVEKLSRGLAAALVRQVRGELSLHASAVRVGESGIVVTGPSGAGKSTLAAMLCRRGGALLADDIAALDVGADGRYFVPPTEHEHALDAASRALVRPAGAARALDDEKRLYAAEPASAPALLRLIVTLAWREGEGGDPSLTPVRGVAAIGALVSAIPRIVVDDARRNVDELAQLARLCARVPIVRLTRPRGATALAASAEQLETRARALEAEEEEHGR